MDASCFLRSGIFSTTQLTEKLTQSTIIDTTQTASKTLSSFHRANRAESQIPQGANLARIRLYSKVIKI